MTLGNYPLLWKEVSHDAYEGNTVAAICFIGAVIFPLLVLAYLFGAREATRGRVLTYYEFARDYLNPTIRVVCLGLGCSG